MRLSGYMRATQHMGHGTWHMRHGGPGEAHGAPNDPRSIGEAQRTRPEEGVVEALIKCPASFPAQILPDEEIKR
jgi:hypothetical protein